MKNPFKQKHKQISIFITAGFPELDNTIDQILFLQEKGIDFIEIGIPFSDPMADGETIQQSSEIALKNGMSLDLLFEQLNNHKNEINVPLVIMSYFNPILNYGFEKFLSKCEEVSIAGLIIPDLSYDLAQTKFSTVVSKSKIPLIHLITPETSNERISKITASSQNGFIYLVSSNSTTGNESMLSSNSARYKEIKELVRNIPLIIGFGIKSKDDILLAQQSTDGVIIGSEYLKRLGKSENEQYLDEILSS